MRNLAIKQLAVAMATAILLARAEAQQKVERRLVVSIPDHKLAVVENGTVVKTYSVATGAPESPSPTGTFRIVNRLVDPTYYAPGKVIGPGAANPLGNRWLGLDLKGFGLHGTNQPKSIGKSASHGCIRIGRRDLEELFVRVRVGDVVEIHGERDETVAAIFGASTTATTVVAQANSEIVPNGTN